MAATVHIMRGIPGSGKSTKAKELVSGNKEFICSADDYFIGADGRYTFAPHKIAEAHAACLKKFINLIHSQVGGRAFIEEFQDIVVDNTHVRREQYEPYVKIAEIAFLKVEFHEFVPPRDNTLGDYVRLCASRNVHGVSPNACMRMASIFEARNG